LRAWIAQEQHAVSYVSESDESVEAAVRPGEEATEPPPSKEIEPLPSRRVGSRASQTIVFPSDGLFRKQPRSEHPLDALLEQQAGRTELPMSTPPPPAPPSTAPTQKELPQQKPLRRKRPPHASAYDHAHGERPETERAGHPVLDQQPGRAEPQPPPPPAAPNAAPRPQSDVDSVRQLFQRNESVETASAPPSPPAEDTSTVRFAEWARTRHVTESEFEELERERRPSAFRLVFWGGLMLLCFAVGLIVGVNWLSRPIETESDLPKADSTAAVANPSSDTAQNTPTRTRSAAPETAPETAFHPHPAAPQASGGAAGTNPPASALETEGAEATSSPAPKPAPPPSENSLAMNHAVEVTPPSEGAPAIWVRLPQIALSASASVAISVQQSVLIPPVAGPGSARPAQLLISGRIASSSVQPLVSAAPIDGNGNVVHLRVWIDPQGEIREIRPIDGRADLIAIGEGEVRGWLQTPPRLAGRPVESVEDVTITFRPMP